MNSNSYDLCCRTMTFRWCPFIGTIFSCDSHPLSVYSSHQLLISHFYGGLPWKKFHAKLCKWPHHPASCSGQKKKNVLFTLLLIIHSLVVLTSKVYPRYDSFNHHCHHPSEEPWSLPGDMLALNLSPCIHAFFYFLVVKYTPQLPRWR